MRDAPTTGPLRVAITGGPCSGKTTLIRSLADAGYATVREAAIDEIAALEEELGGRAAQQAFRRDDAVAFQERVVRRQLANEAAADRSRPHLFLDRSVLDGVAYLELADQEPPAALLESARSSLPHVAFLLDTLTAFDGRPDSGRTSDRERSLRIQGRIGEVYRRFGVPVVPIAEGTPADRLASVLAALGEREPVARARTDDAPLHVVVLAAGFATRLYPLTRDRAKPLLDVGGRPVLSHVLDRILALRGIAGCTVVTNARFHEQFVAWRDGYDADVAIGLHDDGARTNETRRGGATDLLLGFQAVQRIDPTADVVVLAGDNLIEESLDAFREDYARLREPLLLCRRIPGGIPPARHGEATVDGDGRITRFREKPADPDSELAATCFYFFPADVRDQLERFLAEGGDPDAPGHFLTWLVPRRTVHARELVGRTFDIGNLESLERARIEYGG